ncbi:MAG: PEP-CTERM sorting domain-containing protein [Thalassotalea sp.]|nr:PEP-CTERM sorting domain-containing protein [Thalassotalea sp.]
MEDPNYANNWRDTIELFYNMESGSASAEIMCHFNGGNQARIYNNDGSIREDSPWPDMPIGVPFTDEEVGTLEVIQATGQNQVTLGTNDGKYYANVILDESNLGLPQIKVKSESGDFERNSVNGYAATEYLWTGDAETLEFNMDFDFFTSGNSWDLSGAADFQDYIFNLTFGAAIGMQFDPSQTFPIDDGTILSEASFSTVGEPIISGTIDSPYEGSLSVSFDVDTGDQFFLYGRVQAFGLNGGFADASHTVSSRLAVQGYTQEESLQIFTSALNEAVPSVDVPEPSTLAIFTLGIIGLASRRFKK